MYRAILYDTVSFPPGMSMFAQDLILKLLEKNPRERIGAGEADYREIQEHAFFANVHWDDVLTKTLTPEWVPELKSETDTSYFSQEFADEDVKLPEDAGDISTNIQGAFRAFTYVADDHVL
jgi:serine/threonine protein kinase